MESNSEVKFKMSVVSHCEIFPVDLNEIKEKIAELIEKETGVEIEEIRFNWCY